MEVNISSKKISYALLLILMVNMLVLIGTWLHHERIARSLNSGILRFIALMDLGSENTVATWFSSMLLLLVAMAAAGCFFADRQRLSGAKSRLLNLGWIIFVLIFLLLSFDEMGSFHEMIGDTKFFKEIGSNSRGGGWYVFMLLIFGVAIFMMLFSVLKFFRNKVSLIFAVIGVLLFLSNPLQEKLEISSWRNAADPAHWQRPLFFLLLEEGSEIFASFFFFFSFTTYFKHSLRKTAGMGQSRYALQLGDKKSVLNCLVALVALTGLLTFIVRANAWHIPGSDGGIPQNWFPSAMAFLVFLSTLYLFFFLRQRVNKDARIYWCLAMVSLLSSLFYGSDLYNKDGLAFKGLAILILAGSLATGLWSLLKFSGLGIKFSLLSWMVMLLLAHITADFTSTVFEYAAFASLLMGMLLSYCSLAKFEAPGS